jgi:hypothetical protein
LQSVDFFAIFRFEHTPEAGVVDRDRAVADPTFVHRRVRTCSVFLAGGLGVTNCITLVSRGAAAPVAAAEAAEETTPVDFTFSSAFVDLAVVVDTSLLRWLAAIQLPFTAA